MIVRNEAANIRRCLASIVDHISCWVISDTGSADGTPEIIQEFFQKKRIPGQLHQKPFENFESSRNAALECARSSTLDFDYILFCDADMELMVEDTAFRFHLSAPGYLLIQRAGSLTYWNVRLLRREVQARYRGVTHEYLDIQRGVERLRGAWFKDHATGSNRADKFERDIRLLTESLKKDPSSPRSWFYLAQSYRDAGRIAEAAQSFAKRADMGGWEEEAWYARLQYGRCLSSLGDEAGFLRTTLSAYNQRPWRAEPLGDLAQYFRERKMHEVSLLFSMPGLNIRQPEDMLFVDHHAHAIKLKEEFSISAFYSGDEKKRRLGAIVCDWLTLAKSVPVASRHLARHNRFFYMQALRGKCHSTPNVGFGSRRREEVQLNLREYGVVSDSFDLNAWCAMLCGKAVLLIHECDERDGVSLDWHRFAALDSANAMLSMSTPFYFDAKGKERVTGFEACDSTFTVQALRDDGVEFCLAVEATEVEQLLVHRFPQEPALV